MAERNFSNVESAHYDAAEKGSEKLSFTQSLKQNLGKIAYTLDKEYLSRLDRDFYVLPYDESYNSEKLQNGNAVPVCSYLSNVRALRIGRIVYDKEESFTDCFENAISIFSKTGNTVAFVLNRFRDRTDIYAVVKNAGQWKNEESKENIALLESSLQGNFAGSDLSVINESNDGYDTKEMFVCGSDVQSYHNALKNYDRLMDELAGHSYSRREQERLAKRAEDQLDSMFGGKIRSIAALCNIPSAKSKEYLSQNLDKLFNSVVPKSNDEWYSVIILAESYTPDRIHAIREGLEELASCIFPFQQHQFQIGENSAETNGEMQSLSETDSTSEAITKTHSVNIGLNTNSSIGASIGFIAGVNANRSTGFSLGYGYSWGTTKTTGHSDSSTSGTNHSITLGKSESTTYTYKSYTVQEMVSRLEQTLDRVRKGEAIGYWKYATYVCAQSSRISRNVASYIRALTQGEDSFSEPSPIMEWHKEYANGSQAFDEIKKYILNFSHPVFINSVDRTVVDFSANINTCELAYAVSLPQHSIPGVPVAQGVSFGREPHSLVEISQDIELGHAYHMYQTDMSRKIFLGMQELTKHTFLTGSTGSGKSNAIYTLLSELQKKKVPFLVIEPAKGEYKDVFGKKNINVFGTNAKITPLLKINPFSFPEDIHVLEHLDRLIEIFNVCWPMYAAMPAILKDAVERSYRDTGWDIEKSENPYGRIFPSFSDVLDEIQKVLDESAYSEENKGDYTGSLCTRVRSLTTGINGLLFVQDEIAEEKLFDQSTIVDLSRVGSSETKSLIMGILVLKLQEYRQHQDRHNAGLSHVTVLEEAHNILKRTSTEQSMEGANLAGKSVEMISNAIAEMRTYGEGFIIADQAPQLLDRSVIRNTNTKIILRLPDAGDREAAGKSVGLTDEQIAEISKLRRGVAVVSQSDWLEPVLCDINEYEIEDENYRYKNPQDVATAEESRKYLLDLTVNRKLYRYADRVDDLASFRKRILSSNISGRAKAALFECIKNPKSEDKVMAAVYELFHADAAFKRTENRTLDVREWSHCMAKELDPSIAGYDAHTIDLILLVILAEQCLRDALFGNLLVRYVEQIRAKGSVY